MCAINPKFHSKARIDFYTSYGDEADFNNKLLKLLLEFEQRANQDGQIRVHVQEPEKVPVK